MEITVISVMIMESMRLSPMHMLQLLEDSLQMHRLRYVIDGREGDSRDERVQGMLGECCSFQAL